MSTHDQRTRQAASLSRPPRLPVMINTVHVSSAEWLDTDKTMPERDETVVVLLTKGSPETAYLDTDGHWRGAESDERLDISRHAIAWMPLPPVPPSVRAMIAAANCREQDRIIAMLARTSAAQAARSKAPMIFG